MPDADRQQLLGRLAELGASGTLRAAVANAPMDELRGILADYEYAAARPGLHGKWASDADLMAQAKAKQRR
ncbi:MAG: hypothetical protein K2X49_06080 [Acetobacteraceae bacterium]|nr:hypothetical protein [Acetobacteraceae bacterium]